MTYCSLLVRQGVRSVGQAPCAGLSQSFILRTGHTLPEGPPVYHEYGQPVEATHPWVLQAGEAAPGITFTELQSRREALAEILPIGAIALVPSASQQFKSGVIPYPFRQDADFLWLTGVRREGLAVFHKVSQSRMDYSLLLSTVPPSKAVWDGPGMSLSAAVDTFGAHEALPYDRGSLQTLLANKLSRHPSATVFIDRAGSRNVVHALDALKFAMSPELTQAMHSTAAEDRLQRMPLQRTEPLEPLLHRLRWRKSPAECSSMRASAAAAAAAMRACIAATRPGLPEGALEALFDFHSRTHGGVQEPAFPAVVGGGANACTIHHRHTNEILRDRDCVLMDAGGELWGYNSDVSRTWPVDGKFRKAHRVVYEHVLEVHRACIAACVPGATLADIHALSREMLTLALRDIGVDVGGWGGFDVRSFYPHSVGHWLGMDVHDVATVSHTSPLQPGVVLTIEPGLYLRDMSGRVPREFLNIGVRIEDDVLVTEVTPEVLSDQAVAPVAVEEIEALVGSDTSWFAGVAGVGLPT